MSRAERLEARASPEMPAIRVPAASEQFTAIDGVDSMDIFVCKLHGIASVPRSLVGRWARAMAKTLRWVIDAEDAGDDDRLRRALLWRKGLAQFLLRRVKGGGARKRNRRHAVFHRRFLMFENGAYAALLASWASDLEAAKRRGPGSHRVQDDAAKVKRAEELVRAGELSKANSALLSEGTLDPRNPAVYRKLKEKHPTRKADVDFDLEKDFRLADELRPDVKFAKLRRRAGVGPDGWRNEYLIVLDRAHDDPDAKPVMELWKEFARLESNGLFPAWWYYGQTAVRLVALNKGNGDPRPIGVGNSDRRAVAKAIVAEVKEAAAEALAPVQMGVGVRDGAAKLTFSLRASLELHPEWVLILVDKKNAFNEIHRAACIRALAATPGFKGIARFTR